jgi:hypothetical protein
MRQSPRALVELKQLTHVVTLSLRSSAGHADYKTDYRAAGHPWTRLDSAPSAPQPQVAGSIPVPPAPSEPEFMGAAAI